MRIRALIPSSLKGRDILSSATKPCRALGGVLFGAQDPPPPPGYLHTYLRGIQKCYISLRDKDARPRWPAWTEMGVPRPS